MAARSAWVAWSFAWVVCRKRQATHEMHRPTTTPTDNSPAHLLRRVNVCVCSVGVDVEKRLSVHDLHVPRIPVAKEHAF